MLQNKVFFFLVIVIVVLSACDGRHIKHKKHAKHGKGTKKNRINFARIQPAGKKQNLGGVQGGCCASAQAGVPTEDPFSCCQSPSPPPCCQQSAPMQVPMQVQLQAPPQYMPPPGCCSQGNAPMMQQAPVTQQATYPCCQSHTPPPCCQQAMAPPPAMPTPSCCDSGVYLGLAQPDNQCCQSSSPPPCCFGLHLKPGQSKNITMTGGGKNYTLSVKLSKPSNISVNTTANPCSVPTCGPPSSAPTSGASSGPTKGPTSASGTASLGPAKGSNATPGPSKTSTASSGTTKKTTATTATTAPPSGGFSDCQQKALAEHNAKRAIHNAPPMTLDPELNKAAQTYANTIANKKVVAHSLQNQRVGQGENLAKRCSKPDSPFDCKKATDMWYDEIKKYNWAKPGYSDPTGHFTQVIWKATTKLGIGEASFVDKTGTTCHVVVGRYNPAGNSKGAFPANVEKGSNVGPPSQLH